VSHFTAVGRRIQDPAEDFRVLRNVNRGVVLFSVVAAPQKGMCSVEPFTVSDKPTDVR